jgi:RNA polymerase sigma factor (sigma-70 family)
LPKPATYDAVDLSIISVHCMAEDKPLVDRILAGETDLFRILIEQNQRLVSHVVFRLVPNEFDREDICQEVFLKVYRNLAEFRHDSKVSTWIARIAYNTCLNFLEKKKVPLYDDLTDDDNSFEPVDLESSTRPDNLLESCQTASILQDEISKLPATYKAIVTLYHLDQMSYSEIATTLKMPEGTVKNYLFRARKLLKDRLLAKYRQEDL